MARTKLKTRRNHEHTLRSGLRQRVLRRTHRPGRRHLPELQGTRGSNTKRRRMTELIILAVALAVGWVLSPYTIPEDDIVDIERD